MIPCPVSATLTSIFEPTCSTDTSTRPPWGVNFTAFASMFQITCCSRRVSPRTGAIDPGAGENRRSICLLTASGWTTSSAVLVTAIRSTGRDSICSVPAMMRETSSRSSMMCASDAAFRSIVSMACPERSFANWFDTSSRTPAEHRIERRSELVRDDGEKVVPGVLGVFGRLHRSGREDQPLVGRGPAFSSTRRLFAEAVGVVSGRNRFFRRVQRSLPRTHCANFRVSATHLSVMVEPLC